MDVCVARCTGATVSLRIERVGIVICTGPRRSP